MIDAPIAFAFAGGLIAAFNPCGFAMLPAYLSYLLGVEGDEQPDTFSAVERAALVSVVVAGGFAAVFALAGIAVTQFSLSVQRYAPWLTIVVGAALIPFGVAMLRGYEPKVSVPRIGRAASGRGLGAMFVFGVSYAVVSLSCTLPVFLAAAAGTLDRDDVAGSLSVFGAYAAGMALVLTVLTLALALAKRSFVGRLRRVLPYVNKAAGGLLVLAGAYVASYGWFDLRIVRGDTARFPAPIEAVSAASATVASWLDGIGAAAVGVVLTALLVAIAGVGLGVRQRGRRHRETDEAPAET